MTTNERKIALRIAALARKGIKQTDIAREIGKSRQLVNALIHGRSVSLDTQKLIARKAGVAFHKFWL